MNQHPFFTKAHEHDQDDNQLEDYLLEQLATVPKGSRFDGVTNMFDAVVKIYDVATEIERAEMHPFFKMFHDLANGINTVSIDSEEFDQLAETETPQHLNNAEAAVTGKITSIDTTANRSIVNQ